MTRRPPNVIAEGTLAYWADLRAMRSHASAFARSNQRDKRIVERATVQEWMKAIVAVEGLHISKISEGPDNQFPDFYASLSGKNISIELTELLHSKTVIKKSKNHKISFNDIQWVEIHFRQRIQEQIECKVNKLSKLDRQCDVLILHTDEPWLFPQDVEQWLAKEPIHPQDRIKAAFLLMTYKPGWAQHWPIFRLWG